jgi:hypothetical protein
VVRTLVSARGGAAVVGIVIGLGATSVAAYSATRAPSASTPPGVVAAVPTTTPSPKASDRPVGPDAKGPAAFGLCRAWTNHQKHADGKDRAKDSVAMRNLAQAAGGEDRIGAYCATVAHPGTGVKGGDGKGNGNGKGQDKADKAKDKAAKDAAKAEEKAARDAAKAKEKQGEAATPGPKGSTAPSPAPSVAPSIAPSVPVFPSPSVTPTP